MTGVDLAPDMIAVAKTVPAGGAPITWQEADAASLPLPDELYDVALCQMGLMFMEDRAAALREAHRVLTPGGRIVINTPGRIHPLFETMEIIGKDESLRRIQQAIAGLNSILK